MDFKHVDTPEEIKIISDLAYLLFPIDYGGYVRKEHIQYFLDKYQSEAAIDAQIENNFEYVLAKEEGKVVGYIGFEIIDDVLKLSKLYIDFGARGKGNGEKIMAWLKQYAINKRCKRFELLVLSENKNAIRFYKRLGYKEVGVFEEHFKTGYSETNMRMAQGL